MVTVTDACGNSNNCYVEVVGVDKTRPVVNCPTNLIVTNCLVPEKGSTHSFIPLTSSGEFSGTPTGRAPCEWNIRAPFATASTTCFRRCVVCGSSVLRTTGPGIAGRNEPNYEGVGS
jgi:hypothetical protein